MGSLSQPQIRDALQACISDVAPEADFTAIRGDRPWRDQLEVDSFDFQNILAALEQRLGVDVPERDYPRLATLDGFVAYLHGRLGGNG